MEVQRQEAGGHQNLEIGQRFLWPHFLHQNQKTRIRIQVDRILLITGQNYSEVLPWLLLAQVRARLLCTQDLPAACAVQERSSEEAARGIRQENSDGGSETLRANGEN